MNKQILLLFALALFILPLVSASAGTLGTFKQGECQGNPQSERRDFKRRPEVAGHDNVPTESVYERKGFSV